MANGNGSLRDDAYRTERIDDVHNRVARIEGRIEFLASKEDVANVKYSLLLAGISILISVSVGVISVLVHLLSR